MPNSQNRWTTIDRMGLFVLALVLLLGLLIAGLVLTDRSLRQSEEQRATLDATASATIVAQEVELVGERLHEVSVTRTRPHVLSNGRPLVYGTLGSVALEAVWLFDSIGKELVDSMVWDTVAANRTPRPAISTLAHHVAVSQQLQLQGLRGVGSGKTRQALLGEPVLNETGSGNIAVALVDETELLQPAGKAEMRGRSFLALLVDGDTVAETAHMGQTARQSQPVRIPLPGNPEWFIISAQTSADETARLAIWTIGTMTVGLLLLGLVRERRQTRRIGERSVELERLSAELLRANRMKSEFLASVSHELRTPLNAIVGFVDLLRDGGYGELSPKQTSPVERIATSAARLRTLVDQVLDIAKIAAGRLDVRLESVALRSFIVNVVSEIEPLIQEQGLRVSIDVATEQAKIRTDPTHLRQILINLLGNAVKYTLRGDIDIRARFNREGPELRNLAVTGQYTILSLEGENGWLSIEVRDTGIGIARIDQERIFEEFEQVRPGTGQKEEDRGTGLGLPISRRLAALLGGDITVESEVGVGSVFTVWLPIRE